MICTLFTGQPVGRVFLIGSVTTDNCYYNSILFTNLSKIAIIVAEDNEMDMVWETPQEVTIKLARKIKAVRKRKGYTQKRLAERSNVSYASLRKFEEKGEISLISLVKILMELDLIQEFNSLFDTPVYQSIEEVIKDGR